MKEKLADKANLEAAELIAGMREGRSLSQLITFKGDKSGLRIILSADAEIVEVFSELQTELARNSSFFSKGSSASVFTQGRVLDSSELAELAHLLATGGLVLTSFEVNPEARPKPQSVPPAPPEALPLGAKIIKRTLRSGMRVSHDGDVVVIGDLNPGSEVIASGDIIVLGTLRGVVHAGATGDLSAQVIALRLAPTQLRIGDFIARAPDELVCLPDRPEMARVRDGVVVIEAFAS